jgi:hypothetical protein
MPAIANVVVADATPANKTLYPMSASVASSKFLERAANIAAGNRSLELKMSLAAGTRKTDRITVLYARPYEVLVDGVYVVNDVMRFSGEFVIAESVPTTERNHFATEVKNLMALAGIAGYVANRDPYY